MRITVSIAMLASMLAHALPAQATIINGSFEDGLFGWNRLGSTGTIQDVGPHMPTNGLAQAGLETSLLDQTEVIDADPYVPDRPDVRDFDVGDENTGPTAIAPALGLASPLVFEFARTDRLSDGSHPCFDGIRCFNILGAAIWQSFEANAGDSVSFDFNFMSAEGLEPFDVAFATLVTDDGFTIISLADTNNSGLAVYDSSLSADPYSLFGPEPIYGDRSTGYHSASFSLTSTGIATLGFSVLNGFDPGGSSALLVDNVRLVVVSEPCLPGLFAAAALIVLYSSRRSRVLVDS